MLMFNWRPVYNIEQRTKQLRNETELLKIENKRLAALKSRLDVLLLLADTSRNRLHLSVALAVLLEQIRAPKG